MSEEKKVAQIEQEVTAAELSEQDLENVAGGTVTPQPGCILRPPPPPIKSGV